MKTSSLKNLASRRAHGGFTLVELLLVVAIIAVLATLSVSAVSYTHLTLPTIYSV